MWVQSLGWEDPSPGEGNGNLLQYSCLENSMETEACGLQSRELQRLRYDGVTEHTHTHTGKDEEGAWGRPQLQSPLLLAGLLVSLGPLTPPSHTYMLGRLHTFLPILQLLFSGIMEDCSCTKIVGSLK